MPLPNKYLKTKERKEGEKKGRREGRKLGGRINVCWKLN